MLARMGRDLSYLDLAGANPVLAVRQFGQFMASRGPFWYADVPVGDMANALSQSRLRIVNVDHPMPDALEVAGFRMTMTPAHVAELDLTGRTIDRIKNTKAKWRNIWRRARHSPFVIKEAMFAQT